MGAGKSKAVVEAAMIAGVDPIDTDELLEAELGASIAEFFSRAGEAEFRRREEALALASLEGAGGRPIALGGGGVGSERVREALADHLVVWLDVEPEEAWARVEGSERPLARDRGRFEALHEERRPLYESIASAHLPGRRDSVRRALPALEALRSMPAETRMAWATSSSGEYPAFVGRGLLGSRYWPLGGRRFLVTDTVVGGLYGSAIGESAGRVELAPGEQTKTLAETERVLRELAGLGMTRSDHLAALGGGVVGDLAGFCSRRLPARRAGRPGADHPGRSGRLRLRRQDRGRPPGGEELRRRLSPSGGGDRRSGDARGRCRPRSSRRGSSRS